MIQIIKGDISKRNVDCIVNAANNSLTPGSGVNGCIHRAAGNALSEKCKSLAPCYVGQVKITEGYDLPCKNIIHTVGPVYHRNWRIECSIDLYLCYYRSLSLAMEYSCKSIAFPAISTGAYHFPMIEAAPVGFKAIYDFMGLYPREFEKIEIVLNNQIDCVVWYDCYEELYREKGQQDDSQSVEIYEEYSDWEPRPFEEFEKDWEIVFGKSISDTPSEEFVACFQQIMSEDFEP